METKWFDAMNDKPDRSCGVLIEYIADNEVRYTQAFYQNDDKKWHKMDWAARESSVFAYPFKTYENVLRYTYLPLPWYKK